MWVEALALIIWLVLYVTALFSTPLGDVLKLKRGLIEAVKYECGNHWLTYLHLIMGAAIFGAYVMVMNGILENLLGKPPYFSDLALACLSTVGVVVYFDVRGALVKKIEKSAGGELEKGE